ncbi:MAG: hypothetical protein IT514_15250 [Burkholderiales bacterium]|nr:hypothetical protein [Burkholderiales bacterium]
MALRSAAARATDCASACRNHLAPQVPKGKAATSERLVYLYGVGALGNQGARYVLDLFFEELRMGLQQLGVSGVAELDGVKPRHPGAWPSAGI